MVDAVFTITQRHTNIFMYPDQSCRGKLAELNEKVTNLERQIDYLESCIQGAAIH